METEKKYNEEEIMKLLIDGGVKTIPLLDHYKKGGEILYFENENIIMEYKENIHIYISEYPLSKSTKEKILNLIKDFYLSRFKELSYIEFRINDEELVPDIMKICDIEETSRLYNCMFEDTTPVVDRHIEGIEFRPVTMKDWETVFETYTHSGDDPSYTNSRIEANEVIGAYDGEKLAGFISTHSDGSMGMLEVLKEYRQKGIGKQLVYELIKSQRRKRRLLYGQIETWNELSYSIYKNMGFTIDENITTWLFK